MSDYINGARIHTEPLNPYDFQTLGESRPVNATNPLAIELNQKAENIRKSRQWLADQVNFGYGLTAKDYDLMMGIVGNSDGDWEEKTSKIEQALMFSKRDNISFPVAYENLDALVKAETGKEPVYDKTRTKELKDSLDIGWLDLLRRDLTSKLMKEEMADMTPQYRNFAYKKGADQNLMQEYRDKIAAIDEKINSLQGNASKSLLTNVLKATAQSLPYTLDVLVKSSAVGMGAVALGGAIAAPSVFGTGGLTGQSVASGIASANTTNLAASAKLLGSALAGASSATETSTLMTLAQAAYGKAATAAAWKRTSDLSTGAVYYDLREKGVEKDVAYGVASINGVIQGAIETALGVVPAMGRAAKIALLGETAGASLAAKTFAGLYAKGWLGGLAAGVTNVLTTAGGEGLEEFLQSIADNLAEYTALTISKETDFTFDKNAADVLKEAMYEGAMGFGSALIMGLPFAPINTMHDVGYARNLIAEAEVDPSKVHFIKKHFEDDQFSGLPSSERREALAQVYEKNHTGETTVDTVDPKTIDTDYIPINENLAEGEEEQASRTPLKPIQRRKDNRLHTQEMIGSEKNPAVIRHNDGSESHTLLLGTADVTVKENNRYGYIDYTISPDYQKVTIDDVMMKPGQESLTGEFVTELMRRYPGLEIEWSPETDAQKKIKEELIANNTENPGKLQMFKRNQSDMDKILKVAGYIKKIAPNVDSDQAAVLSTIFSYQAEKQNISLEEFVENNIQFKTLQQGIADNDFTEREKAEILSGTKKGAYKPNPLDITKGIIYVGEHGDASTFLHEGVHGFVMLDPEAAREVAAGLQEYIEQNPEGFKKYLQDHAEIMKGTGIVNANKELDIERIFSEIKDMADPLKWNANQHEIVAVIAETNFQEGQTFDPRLKTLFDKIIDFFLRIYRTLKKRSKLNDRTIKAYDRLIAGNPELKAKMDAMETTENQGVRSETLKAGETPSAEFTFKNPVEMDAETVAIGGGIEQAVNALRGYTLEDGTVPDGLIIHDGGNATYVRLDNQKGQTSNALSTREAAIRKYTDKSRYSSENIYGDVYVDDRRVEQAGISDQAREEYEKELEAAKRFSKRFNCEVFLLPEGDENGNAVYVDKHKNPDAIIQGYFVDFKQAKGTDGSVTRQFVRGLGQAEGVVLTVGNGTSISDAVHWINGKLNSLKKSYDGFIVIIEDYKGNYGTYSVNAKRLSVQENPFTTALGLSSPNLESENSQVNSNINPTDNSVNPQTYFQTDISAEDRAEAERQYAEVEAKYKGTDQWLKAPNGKPTKLTERQWVQVRTPNFKAWFGDWENDPENASKVVDENGEPKVVYHGTDLPFDVFRIGRGGYYSYALYFTDNKEEADKWGRNADYTKAVFLNIRNMNHIGSDNDMSNDLGKRQGEYRRDISPFIPFNERMLQINREFTEQTGIDGFDVNYKGWYLALQPNQIKSATDNAGTFNPDNDSILWQSKTPQEIENELVAEAKGSWTVEEWIDYARNGLHSTIDDETLRSYWEKANNVTETPEGQKIINTENLSEEDKDNAFNALIDTEDGVRRVIEDMRAAIAYKDEVFTNGTDNEEARDRAKAIDDAVADFNESAAKIIKNVVNSKEEISDEAIKSIQGIMRKNVTEYRDIYSKFTGRGELSLSNDAVPFIDEPTRAAVATKNPAEKRRMAEQTGDKELAEALTTGTEKVEGRAEQVIKEYTEAINTMTKDADQLEESINAEREKIIGKFNKEEQQNLLKQAESYADYVETRDKLSSSLQKMLDAKQTIPNSKYEELNKLNDTISNIEKSLVSLRKLMNIDAYLKRLKALKKLRQQISEKKKQRREAAKVKQYKKSLVDYILQDISKNVYWEQAEKAKALQAIFGKPSKYDSQYITYNGKKMLLKDFKAGIEDGSISIPELSDYQLRRYLNKDISEYTVEELETMADTIRYLIQGGRQQWQAMVDARSYEAEQWQRLLINQMVKHPRYMGASDSPLPGTAEDIKKEKNLWNIIRTGWYKTLNMARKAQILDNNKKDVAYRLLVEEYRDHLRNELEAIRKRMKPVQELMEKLNVKPEDFYNDTYRLKIGPHEVTFNVSQLIYGVKSQLEQRNRDAFVYGNLFNAHEKPQGVNRQWLENEGDKRLAEFNKQAEEILKGKENLIKVADAIWADWQDKDNFNRLNMAAIAEYNQAVDPVQFYMPIVRRDFNGTDLPSKIANDIYNQNAGKNMTSVEKGMIESRITIPPENQQPIDMDYFKIWNESVMDQEHFIETNAYVRKLNRVFKARGSKDLKATIENVYGQGMKNDIDNYINEIANPDINTDTQGVNKFITFLRGALYPAYLAFKASSVILQMITSPAPFLREVGPIELAKGLVQMSLHPVETWRYVSGLSAIMENRSMNPLLDEVKKAAKNYTDPKYKRLWHKIQETGTMGLEMADRWSVTAGWLAVFTKKKEELVAGGMEEKEAQNRAVKYADNVVLETQPTGDKAELAPLFKMGGPAWQAFTQFQVSLNVIWNNLTYDVAFSDRYNHEKRKAAGTLIGYALAGVILYAVQEGFDDDDDAEDVILKLLYGATTQYTSSIPLVSSSIDNMARSWMTGDSWTSRSNQLYPGFDTLMQGVTNLDFNKFMRGDALMKGVPVSGYKEFEHAFYNRKTGELRFYPKAFLGQRENNKKKKK